MSSGTMRFAAIDAGSNAVRLLLSQVLSAGGPPLFKKDTLVRFPLRLGEDAFPARRISRPKIDQLLRVMSAFRHLMDAYEPLAYRACATSAMREAGNRAEIIRMIRREAGIELEVIDGRTEAEIICSNHTERSLGGEAAYLYIDVGGGSTQLTLFNRGRSAGSRSFDIGTLRLLKGLVDKPRWREMRNWIRESTAGLPPLAGIGSGGNINKTFMLAGRKPGRPLSRKTLEEIHRMLARFDVEDRVRRLGLRPDRADVIVPALEIFLQTMKWAGVDKLHVPFIGLVDGLIHGLYERQRREAGSRS